MKAILARITTVAIVLTSVSVGAEQPDMTVELECADALVVGMPTIMTVSIQNRNPAQSPFAVPKIDLASELDQGIALAFKFESESGTATQVGYPAYGLPEVEFGTRPPRLDLNVGETATVTFDLNQLLFGGELREGKVVPPGKYRVTALFYSGAWKSVSKAITIREPTAQERRFLDAIEKQGVGKKWFPAVITDDRLQVPDDIALPAETGQLRDFIKVLRLAVRNPDAAVKDIEGKKASWGNLLDTVTELKYECVAKSKGKDSPAAQDMRRTLDADAKMKGRLTRIEKGGGLLENFAKLMAAKSKEK